MYFAFGDSSVTSWLFLSMYGIILLLLFFFYSSWVCECLFLFWCYHLFDVAKGGENYVRYRLYFFANLSKNIFLLSNDCKLKGEYSSQKRNIFFKCFQIVVIIKKIEEAKWSHTWTEIIKKSQRNHQMQNTSSVKQ